MGIIKIIYILDYTDFLFLYIIYIYYFTFLAMHILSFHLPFDNFRPLTNKKANVIEGFFKAKKWIFNQVNNDFTTNHCFPYYPSKDDITFTKKFYYNHISDISNLKSYFSQNISNHIVQNFIHTKKSFFSKLHNSNKPFFKSPKQYSFQPFPLDTRMLSAKNSFIVESEYRAWLKLSNPFKNNSTKFINIPIKLFPKVNELLSKWFKYTFSLKSDWISIIFKCPSLDLIDISKATNKLAIDFGKYTSTFHNDENITQYDLSQMYNNIKKIKSDIEVLSSEISVMKGKHEWWEKYDELKLKRQKLFTKIKNVRKTVYGWISNRIIESTEVIIAEDLSFTAKKSNKANKSYVEKANEKRLNVLINEMARSQFMVLLEQKAQRFGKPVLFVQPHYTSLTCYNCWKIDKENRKGRVYSCSCWYQEDADVNASKNIMKLWERMIMSMK